MPIRRHSLDEHSTRELDVCQEVYHVEDEENTADERIDYLNHEEALLAFAAPSLVEITWPNLARFIVVLEVLDLVKVLSGY